MALFNISRQLIKRAFFALLHAVLMLVILAIWTSFDFALELENNFLKWQSTLENFAWSSKSGLSRLRILAVPMHPSMAYLNNIVYFCTMDGRIDILKGIHPGLVIERELKQRGLRQNTLAEMIGEHPQTLSAIIKGRRNMNVPLALKIETALEMEEGFLMTLQVYSDIKTEKRRQQDATGPDLSKLRRVLFWDTSVDKIDWQRQKRSVIRRVFERGNAREKVEIRRFYGKGEVAAVLSGMGGLQTS